MLHENILVISVLCILFLFSIYVIYENVWILLLNHSETAEPLFMKFVSKKPTTRNNPNGVFGKILEVLLFLHTRDQLHGSGV